MVAKFKTYQDFETLRFYDTQKNADTVDKLATLLNGIPIPLKTGIVSNRRLQGPKPTLYCMG